jgi:hypothetical protein
MPAKIEEVLLDAHSLHAEHLLPHIGDLFSTSV